MPSVGMRRSTRVFVPKSVSKDVDGNRGAGGGGFDKSGDKNKFVVLALRSARGGGGAVSGSGGGCGNNGGGGDGCRKDWRWFLGERPGNNNDDDNSYCKTSKKNEEVHEQEKEKSCLIDEETKSSSPSSSLESVKKLNVGTEEKMMDKMFGRVYSRKRRKLSGQRFVSSSSVVGYRNLEDRMFGIPFVRKRPRSRSSKSLARAELANEARVLEVRKEEQEVVQEEEGGLELVENLVPQLGQEEGGFELVENVENLVPQLGQEEGGLELVENHVPLLGVVENGRESENETILSFVVESSSGSSRFTCFLASVLQFMRKSSLRLSLLGAFMSSEPISQVFDRNGIRFLNDPLPDIAWNNGNSSNGTCRIQGTHHLVILKLVPIFCVDFLAVPHSFVRLHSCIALRSLFRSSCFVRGMGLPSMSVDVGVSESNSLMKRNRDMIMGLDGFSLISRNVRRKRSSLRTGRVTNTLSMEYFSHSDDTDFVSGGDSCNLFAAPESRRFQKKVPPMTFGNRVRSFKSTLVDLKQNWDLASCNATILVIESDKCYREEGAEVMLEYTASQEWVLIVKTQGFIRYSCKANDLVRPSSTNRHTHAMIWNGDNGCKLEFPNRRQWLIFKELNKECYRRNTRALVKVIPVPWFKEVTDYENVDYVPFVHPDAYITMRDDEVARASMRTVPNYDVDSSDEGWLERMNKDHLQKNKGLEFIHVEKFEEMIDTFEKVAFYCPDDAFDEDRAASLCPDVERDVVRPVYQQWLKKRKRKRGPLLRVFQLQNRQPKKTQPQVLNRPVLRKRRSSKKQNRPGRGKQWNFLEDSEREEENIRRLEEENMRRAKEENMRRAKEENMLRAKEENMLRAKEENRQGVQEENMGRTEEEEMLRVEELNKSLRKSQELAILKRNRAQTLMEAADLAAYWATMAVRIAEAAQVAESSEIATSSYIDNVRIAEAAQVAESSEIATSSYIDNVRIAEAAQVAESREIATSSYIDNVRIAEAAEVAESSEIATSSYIDNVRIAEAAQVAESSEIATSSYIDNVRNAEAAQVAESSEIATSSYIDNAESGVGKGVDD